VVVALFVTGPAECTLRRQMFNGIREDISPVIAAAATLFILLSVLLLTTIELLRRRNERLRGIRPG
jgi:putative spermidine/putrescine transport system permease protein